MSNGDFMGWGYAPNGFINPADERAQHAAMMNPWYESQKFLESELPGLAGDEHYQTNTFGWIPTEQQVAAGIAVINMQADVNQGPYETKSPALAQLIKSLYDNASSLWQTIYRVDASGGEGW